MTLSGGTPGRVPSNTPPGQVRHRLARAEQALSIAQCAPADREGLRMTSSGGSHIALPEGELIGPGDGPLGHADDRRRWEPDPDQSGPRIYAASRYVVIIQWGVERGTVQVDPGRRYWEPFIAALEAARAYANRRSPRSPWPTKGETR